MKPLMPIVATALLLVTGTVMAQKQERVHQPAVQQHMQQMQQMHETMARIRATEDPEERAALLDQHMDEMHAAMAEMQAQMTQMMEHMQAQRQQARRLRAYPR